MRSLPPAHIVKQATRREHELAADSKEETMDAIRNCCRMAHSMNTGRRMWLKAAVSTVTVVAGIGFEADTAEAAALTKEKRDSLTPDQIIELMKKGNARFRAGKMQPRDFLAQKRASAAGQYPAAVILSCIDSRAPAEI